MYLYEIYLYTIDYITKRDQSSVTVFLQVTVSEILFAVYSISDLQRENKKQQQHQIHSKFASIGKI